MKIITLAILFLVLLSAGSCSENETVTEVEYECLPAVYVTNYCPANEQLSFVKFLKESRLASSSQSIYSDSVSYVAAVLDLPKEFQKIDTVFYMRVRRDPVRESKVKITYCQAIFSIVNILVCEAVLNEGCP